MAHIGLINELNNASSLLQSALNQYTEACAAILRHFKPSGNTAQDLLGSVLAECPKAFNYQAKLEQAIAFMYRVRNQSPSFVPISVLPPEIISRIFQFSERCCLPGSRWKRRNAEPDTHLVYPKVALEVCHHWRQIALASHGLWSHIDIDTTSESLERFFSRALRLVAKSGQVPIDLHIGVDFYCTDDQRLTDLFDLVAPRIQSINLQCDNRRSFHPRAQLLLEGLFSRAIPGILRNLCLNSQIEPGFLVAGDSTALDCDPLLMSIMWTIPLAESVFERVLSSVMNMQLDGMYPYWTSRAYAGLTELELEIPQIHDVNIAITKFELANILRASPRLRVICFNLKLLFESEISETRPEPVELDYLETIRLAGTCPSAQEAVLGMIYPGKLPLQMSLEVAEDSSLRSPYRAQFINFISRSNITQLRIQGARAASSKIYIELSEILPLLSHLRVLTLCGIILGQACEEVLGDYDVASFLALIHDYKYRLAHQNLQFLRLVKCRVYWADFRHMTELHPTQTLILDQCKGIKCRTQDLSLIFGRKWSWTDTLRDEALKICPGALIETHDTVGRFEELNIEVESPHTPQSAFGDNNVPTSPFGQVVSGPSAFGTGGFGL